MLRAGLLPAPRLPVREPGGESASGHWLSRLCPRSSERPAGNRGLVREAYRLRFNSGQAEETARSIDRFLELLAPDVEFVASTGIPSSHQGRSAVGDLLHETAREWEECSFAAEEVVELDAGRVLASGTVLARPFGKTEVYEIPFANLWTFEGGRAIRIESFTDREQAQAALGSDPGD